MYKLCKTERSAARQRELEQGLLELMLVHSYEELTVSDICAYLKIPRKSFYRYFASKEGALTALVDHTLLEYESFSGSYQQGEHRSIEKDLERFFLFWKDQRPLMDALEKNGLSAFMILRSLKNAQTGGTIPRRFLMDETADAKKMVVWFSMCGLMAVMLEWHHSGYPTSPAYMGRVAARLLSRPLFQDISGKM